MTITPKERKEFAFLEYQEAANAYFKGVETGLSYIRLFFFINAALSAGFVTCWQLILSQGSSVSFVSYLVLFLAGFGCALSFLLLLVSSGYNKQLGNCIKRATTIEEACSPSDPMRPFIDVA